MSESMRASDLAQEARKLAQEISEGMTWTHSSYGGYWTTDRKSLAAVRALVATALHFLESNAGKTSQYYRSAVAQFQSSGEN